MKLIAVAFVVVLIGLVGTGALNARGEKKEAAVVADEKDKADAASAQKKDGRENVGLPTRNYSDNEFAPKPGDDVSIAWMFFEVLLILGLFGFGFYVFFRFVSKKSGINAFGQGVMTVLSVVPIGQNKFIHIVDMAGKILILGVSDNNINLITEVNNKDEIDRIRILSSRKNEKVKGSFQDNIKKHISGLFEHISDIKKTRLKKDEPEVYYEEEYDSGVDLEYLKKQRERLKDLNGKK